MWSSSTDGKQHGSSGVSEENHCEDDRHLTSDVTANQTVFCFLPVFPSALRAEEEKLKKKDEERRELEETVDVLRKELNKTEQARKDASIKVETCLNRSGHTCRLFTSNCN